MVDYIELYRVLDEIEKRFGAEAYELAYKAVLLERTYNKVS